MPSPALSARWIQKRQAHWTRLDALLARCGRQGVRALPYRELQELALLYRQTAADLSAARADPTSAALARRLNERLGRAHNLLYGGKSGSPRAILRFYAATFPQVFRGTWAYTAAAALLFVACALAGVATSAADPSFDRFVLGGAMLDTIDRREMWTHGILAIQPAAAAGIMTNNLAVTFLTFAGGIAGGLGTLFMVIVNGVLIGVVGMACARGGLSLSLWSFVAPHGALELPALMIGAGAGFVLARGVLVPGLLSRRDALIVAGGQAIRLLLGVFPLLVIAGLIEAFVSPTAITPMTKFTIGAGLFVLLLLYLFAVGRARGARAAAVDAAPTAGSAP